MGISDCFIVGARGDLKRETKRFLKDMRRIL